MGTPRAVAGIAFLVPLLAVAALVLAPIPAHAYGEGWITMWGYFDLPVGIATDSDGNVYVVDRNTDRVQKFTNDGAFIQVWHLSGSGSTPYAIAVDGGYVYVADGGYDRIVKFTTSGAFVMQWGTHGSGNGQLSQPLGIGIDGNHDVYVSDSENHRIEKFSSTGTYITQWSYDGHGQLAEPRGIVVDADGIVYVAEMFYAAILKFTSTGTYLGEFGRNELGYAVDVDMAADGTFYVADAFYHRVVRYTHDGSQMYTFGTYGTDYFQFRYPWSVAVDAAGHCFVADYQNLRASKWAPCPDLPFSLQPVSQVLPYGATAVFSAVADSAVSYQWTKDGVSLIDGGRIGGALTPTLTIADFQPSDEGSYQLVVSNWCNQANESDPASLSLADTPTCFGPLAPPPNGMAAWWAMEDGPGHTIPDVLNPHGNKNHASLTGAAWLVPGKVGTAVRCAGVNDGLHVPNTLSPRLAASSTGLSIDAWILPRSGSASSAYRMILEKGLLAKASVNGPGGSALAPGYAFYLHGGTLGFQMPDPGYNPVRFEPAMTPMSMDEWHHVAVTVDPLVSLGSKLYLDGVAVASFTAPSGILGNLADLYIGRFTPQLGPATPDSAFNGDIDEVEIFVNAIDSAAVRKIWSAGCSGKRRLQVLTNSTVSLRENNAAADVCSAVLNLSTVPHDYQWSIAAVAGSGCPSAVPVTFTPASGSMTVNPGERLDFSCTASVSPGSLTTPFARCFQLTVTDLGDQGVLTAGGTLSYSAQHVSGKSSCTPPDIDAVTFTSANQAQSGSGVAHFTLFNDGPSGTTVDYSVATRDLDTGGASAVLRLNGQAAGAPVTGSIFVPGQSSVDVPIGVSLAEYDPFLLDELVLSTAGGGEQASLHVTSTEDTSLALTAVIPGEWARAPRVTLRAMPNPFRGETTVWFTVPRDAPVEIDVLDVSGRQVRRILSTTMLAGPHRATWDGRDDGGSMVRAGIYLARVRTANQESVARIARIP